MRRNLGSSSMGARHVLHGVGPQLKSNMWHVQCYMSAIKPPGVTLALLKAMHGRPPTIES